MELKFSPKLFSQWIMSVLAASYVIWYACIQCVHQDFVPPINRAFVYIGRVIRDANVIQKGCMDNSVNDLVLLKKFGVVPLLCKAPSIVAVRWVLPDPP